LDFLFGFLDPCIYLYTIRENAMPENPTQKEKSKKTIERSASYPGTLISEVLNFAGTVSKNFTPQHIITRDDMAAVTKIKTVHRITAAAVQYGIFVLAKSGYQISPVYKEYLNPVSQEEKNSLLLSFFTSPKLYSDLIEKYNKHVIPPELKSILVRYHKIAANAAEEVADIFIENARFVGALNDSDILDVTSLNKPIAEPPKPLKQEPGFKPADTSFIDGLFNPNHGQEEVKVVLTEGKYCFIKYPKNISDKDVLILKKWMELLELTLT
jgi:hypothetical protein